jgi:polyhydroxyalkanoate synthesis repressor PhaR
MNTAPEMPRTRPNKNSITIKKYANRRLYNTATSTYVTLEDLAQMVKAGTEFNVYDAKTSEDLTRSVLTQIIVEEEGKSGASLLPVNFLRQIIGYYGKNMQWLVPHYLDHSMNSLTENQGKFRDYMQSAMQGTIPTPMQNSFGGGLGFQNLEELSKQNLAMFEKLFSPFGEGMKQARHMMQSTAEQQMQTLQQQLQAVHKQLAELSKTTKN